MSVRAIDRLKETNPMSSRTKDFGDLGLGKVTAAPFTIGMREKINRSMDQKKNHASFLAYAMVFMLRDEKGDDMFTLEDFKSLVTEVPEHVVETVGSWLVFDDAKN